MPKEEIELRQEDVWDEHLREVSVGRHWTYLIAVLAGGFVVMIALIAVLGSGSGG